MYISIEKLHQIHLILAFKEKLSNGDKMVEDIL